MVKVCQSWAVTLSAIVILWFWAIAPAGAETPLAEQVAQAQAAADTGFLSSCSALVLLMTVGLAFFYGGFVAKRNVLNTLMMSFIALGIVSIAWILWGYSLAFAPGLPIIGGIQWFFLNGVGLETTGYLQGSAPEEMLSYAPTVPHQGYMIYMAMFAIITPALISGAIVERASFKSYCVFLILWLTLIYCPLAHMIWGKGGLLGLAGILKAMDFAGGTVVHTASGVSALVAALVIGPRKTYPNHIAPPHNVPFILLGAGLLWYGWFGFNAGSALAAGPLSVTAFITTNTSAAAAMLTWLVLEQLLRGKPTSVGAATGIVVGLVGITPGAGFVSPMSAIAIGVITAIACFFAITFKIQLGIDDSLDTFPVHGVGGIVGTVLTGVFASLAINSSGAEGLIAGNPFQLLIQIVAVAVTVLWSALGTFIILKVIQATLGLRLQAGAELQGLDINEHGEEAYGHEFLSRESVLKK
ncbi:ammonium transporter [Synechocystis sp. LKSZ1]|uniref:ammonium transporter n=1 Tax=Synechocystis sp. LKSZ1 TaxID=3144951 RepID=UPI00336BEDD3